MTIMNKYAITGEYLKSRGISHGLCFTGALIKEDPLEFSRCTNIAAERRVQVLLHEDFIDAEALLELCDDAKCRTADHRVLLQLWHNQINDMVMVGLQRGIDSAAVRDSLWEGVVTKLRPHLHYHEVAKCRARMNAWNKERAE